MAFLESLINLEFQQEEEEARLPSEVKYFVLDEGDRMLDMDF